MTSKRISDHIVIPKFNLGVSMIWPHVTVLNWPCLLFKKKKKL